MIVSHNYNSPLLVPTANNELLDAQHNDVIESYIPKSQSLMTLLVIADHKYTHDPKPTANILLLDQSIKLR